MKKILQLFFLFTLTLQASEFYYLEGSDSRYQVTQDVIKKAKEEQSAVLESPFFDSENKAEHLHGVGKKIILDSEDSQRSLSFLIDNGSKKLVVVVPPLHGRRERMAHLGAVYKNCDLLFIPCYWSEREFLKTCLPYWFGGAEEQVLTIPSSYAVLAYEWAKKNKYNQVMATGVCYGACLVLEAQRLLQEKDESFDGIILDSTPTSFEGLRERSFIDPAGVMSGGADTSSDTWKGLVRLPFVQGIFNGVTYWLCPEISFSERAKKINCPVQFFHGTDDASVSDEQFNENYNAIPHEEKCAFVTPSRHLRHFKSAPELYTYYVQEFLARIEVEEL